jgi:hypothetical protein
MEEGGVLGGLVAQGKLHEVAHHLPGLLRSARDVAAHGKPSGAASSQSILRVQHTRLEASYFHARCALAMAALGFDARGMAAVASRDAQRIERENMPWSSAFARLRRATIAYQEGNVERAVEGLTAATEGFSAAHMQLYAAGCRRRLSAIVRGGWGHSLRRDADQWMAAQDIPNGAAMTRMVAPGFPD